MSTGHKTSNSGDLDILSKKNNAEYRNTKGEQERLQALGLSCSDSIIKRLEKDVIEHLYVRAYWSAWQGIAPEQIKKEQMPLAEGMHPFINRADAVKILEEGIEAGIERMHNNGKVIL